MRTTDSQGRPMRIVPRQPSPLDRAATTPDPGPAPLPPEVPAVAPEAHDLQSAMLLATSLRSALLRLGWVREER